jgi:hypothetical protein
VTLGRLRRVADPPAAVDGPGCRTSASYDPETKTLTGWMEMPNPMGGTSRAKTVEEWPDEGARIIRVYPTMDAPEPFMTMTYKKRK